MCCLTLVFRVKKPQTLKQELPGGPQEKAKLAREVEDLNATVFSKSFKAPSAWAEREVKYKAERRDWDAAERKLRERIATLEAENARYRADNKAAEFEARIQVRRGPGPPFVQHVGSGA